MHASRATLSAAFDATSRTSCSSPSRASARSISSWNATHAFFPAGDNPITGGAIDPFCSTGSSCSRIAATSPDAAAIRDALIGAGHSDTNRVSRSGWLELLDLVVARRSGRA